jgi:hypothetical protein
MDGRAEIGGYGPRHMIYLRRRADWEYLVEDYESMEEDDDWS